LLFADRLAGWNSSIAPVARNETMMSCRFFLIVAAIAAEFRECVPAKFRGAVRPFRQA
jgi:hypothetical protein